MAWRRGQSYGQDLRDRVLSVSELSARAAAERFGVSESYVVKARARLRDTGEREARAQRNHVARKLSGHEAALREQVAAEPDATLAELCAWLLAEHAVAVGKTGVWKELARLGLTLKKSTSGRPSRTATRSRRRAGTGPDCGPRSIRAGSCSSTRPGQRPP